MSRSMGAAALAAGRSPDAAARPACGRERNGSGRAPGRVVVDGLLQLAGPPWLTGPVLAGAGPISRAGRTAPAGSRRNGTPARTGSSPGTGSDGSPVDGM